MNKSRSIAVSILVCLGFLVLYDLSVRFVISDWPLQGDSQLSKNIITAEKYIYAPGSPQVVLVGSSLARRFEPDAFSLEIFNLSFSGKGALDGLSIIEKVVHIPRIVLIETNYLARDRDPSFTDPLFREPAFTLKQFTPVLKEKYRPLNSLQSLIDMSINGKPRPNIGETVVEPEQSHTINHEDKEAPIIDSLLKRVIERQSTWFTEASKDKTLIKSLQLLKNIIDGLQESGVKVVFFEMPMHQQICKAQGYLSLQETIVSRFPTGEYFWLSSPDCNEYKTTDGIHLKALDADRYARDISQQLQNLGLFSSN